MPPSAVERAAIANVMARMEEMPDPSLPGASAACRFSKPSAYNAPMQFGAPHRQRSLPSWCVSP